MASIYATPGSAEDSTDRGFRTDDEPRVDTEAALAALNDPDCRDLLAAATDEARTAAELIDECAIPRSTGYRKIDRLSDAGLFEEGVRLRAGGGHASEYRRAVDEVTVSLSSGDGVVVDARDAAAPASDRVH